jgi:hypothetical protein
MVIADGVRANDRACIELAIRFIELFFMGSYAGHVLARRLQSASLSAQDRARLADRFFDLVAHAELGAVRQNLAALWRIVSASKAATTEPADARRDGHRVTLVQRLLRDLRPLRRPAFAGV